jgi:phosphatidylserine decarboxylase
VAVDTVRLVPKGIYSAAVGWGSRRRVPRVLRSPIYRAFARWVGARLDEAELPLDAYATFGDFFARRLRAGARALAADGGAVVSPCDGVVAACGRIDAGRMIQAKGIDYALADFVCDPALAAALDGGTYCTIYLSPKDYHRVHAPIGGLLRSYRYVPGALFPVNPLFTRRVEGLLVLNERVVLELETPLGAMALAMVAAVGVGNMALTHAGRDSAAWRRAGEPVRIDLAPPVSLERGDEVGAFQLGSTVVLLCAPGRGALDGVEEGAVVRFGEPIGGPASAGHARSGEPRDAPGKAGRARQPA